MEQLADSEIWRQIPPEEKLQLMSRAHASGVSVCWVTILIGCTLAVGLKVPWLIWTSIILCPLLFQFAAGKAWRDLRPRMMLEYLAARSAARRYAFSANSQDLGISLMFKGQLEEVFENQHSQEAMESLVENNRQAAVWIALFNDALVMMSEKPGGAHCEFASVLSDKLQVKTKNLDDQGDYSANKEIFITLPPEKLKPERKYKITSPYPAAMVVFEKRLQQTIERAAELAQKTPALDMESN